MNRDSNPRARRTTGRILMLALALIAAGCSDEQSAPLKTKLVIAISAEPPSLNAMYDVSQILTSMVAPNVAPALGGFDDDGNVTPLIAESWVQTAPEVWQVKIKQGIKFSNGKPLTAKDAAASINYGSDGGHANSFYSKKVKIAKALDDRTLQIDTAGPDPILYRRLPFMFVLAADTLSPSPSSDTVVESFVGAGPYVIDKWNRGQSIVFKRNPSYYGDAPQYETVELIFRADESVRASAVAAGEADLAPISLESKSLVPQLIQGPGIEVSGFLINTNGQKVGGSIMSDKRVRLAVNHAVDRRAIIDSIFGGQAVPSNCQINPPYFFGHNPNLTDYPYDLALAKKLIREAGVEGARVDLYTVPGYYRQGDELSEVVMGALAAIGLKPVETKVQLDQFVEDYVASSSGAKVPWDLVIASHDNATLESTIKTFDNFVSLKGGGNGRWLIDDPALDAAIKATREVGDPATREGLMRNVWKIFCDGAYSLAIAVPNSLYGAGKGVQYTPRADQQLIFTEIRS